MYDLIGDIHGHADELVALLRRMDYREERGAFRHPERTAVFVGDFIDRGPKILQTLRLVRSMLEAGSALAVLGNHEWNAFCYHFEDPDAPGEHLREHSRKNNEQHRETLSQVLEPERASHLSFLRTLPMRLSLPGAKVVHACWDEVAFEVVEEALLRHGGLTDNFLIEGSRQGTPLYAAIEIVLKGKEMALPPGESFRDKEGVLRHDVRVRWYESPEGHTVTTYSLPRFEGLSSWPLPKKVVADSRPYPQAAVPVFFGHYWLNDPIPERLAPNVACLDYSVAKQGRLCAYRLEGEPEIDSTHFVSIPANRLDA